MQLCVHRLEADSAHSSTSESNFFLVMKKWTMIVVTIWLQMYRMNCIPVLLMMWLMLVCIRYRHTCTGFLMPNLQCSQVTSQEIVCTGVGSSYSTQVELTYKYLPYLGCSQKYDPLMGCFLWKHSSLEVLCELSDPCCFHYIHDKIHNTTDVWGLISCNITKHLQKSS